MSQNGPPQKETVDFETLETPLGNWVSEQ